ncbi:hypothetical protein MMC10_010928 [Thelotrema lepadinum]|nr:hypothetical protein [Thelotrema lepadinum]
MEAHWKPIERSEWRPLNWSAEELLNLGFFVNRSGIDPSQASMFVLAAAVGLRHYVNYNCTSSYAVLNSVQIQQGLLAAVFRASHFMDPSVGTETDYSLNKNEWNIPVTLKTYRLMIEDLLSAGADPNLSEGMQEYSPWTIALEVPGFIPINHDTPQWCEILSLMLRYGADPKKCIQQCNGNGVSLLTTMICGLTPEPGNRQPASNDEVYQSLINLKATFLEYGVIKRGWVIIKKRYARQIIQARRLSLQRITSFLSKRRHAKTR